MQEACDTKAPRSAIIGFVPDEALKAEVFEFKNTYPIKVSVSFACCYLLRKGLDAVKAEKEAARG